MYVVNLTLQEIVFYRTPNLELLLGMRKTKEDADATKQAILDAAILLFSEHGVAKTSLEKIAKQANVTRGAVYWHFASKQEIFEALHDQLHSPFIQTIVDGLENITSNPIEQLQKVCTDILIDLEINEAKRKIATLFLLRCDYSGEFAESKARFNAKKAQKHASLSKYFSKAIEQGIFSKDTDSTILTIGLSAYLRGLAVEYLEDPSAFSMQRKAARLIQMYLGNLQCNK